MTASLSSRSTRLFMALTAFFVGNAVVAEFVGVKIFALETTFGLAPADWWVTVNAGRGVPDMQAAYGNVFGQGLWTIGGSLAAFPAGQMIDVATFHRIRMVTGEMWIWLRATASAAVSQLVDSFVVRYIAFVLGPQQRPVSLFLAVGIVNYCYKMVMAVLLSPLIYMARHRIEAYLGLAEAARLKAEAAAD
jgi:uncharacterized PurR-regulated membrane protein YhhQ (DUF165 family)